MKKVYEAYQLLKLYELAHESNEINRNDLYENMALQFTYQFRKLYDLSSRTIYIFAGYGINGACALAVARFLAEHNYRIRAYLFYRQGTLESACEYQRDKLQSSGGPNVALTEVSREFRMPTFTQSSIIIDGLFGSELASPLEGGYLSLVKKLNMSGLPIVSIDLPTGLYAEYNTPNEHEQAIRATHTITFEAPRLAMLFPENQRNVGQWHALPLNISEDLQYRIDSKYRVLTEEGLSGLLQPRSTFATKRSCGSVLLIGGSPVCYGKLILAARAALRSGCGSLTLHAPLQVQSLIPLAVPEVETTAEQLENLPHNLHRYQAVGIGTGMRHAELSAQYLYDLFTSYALPIVLDDVAIDLLCEEKSLLEVLPRNSVLLCSEERQRRLLGEHKYMLDTLAEASEFAVRYSAVLVLKGAYTAICSSTGEIYFSTMGHASLASAGCGDVFTGILLGLMARGYESLAACQLACGVLGRGAELCVARSSEESLTASDVVLQIGKALKEL